VLGRGDVGQRVVVRRFVEIRNDRPLFTDVVGDLVAWEDESITVVTRRGPVTVPIAAIVAGKRIPPPAPRRGTRPGTGTPDANA
jgi:N-acetylglutamate synthase